VITKEMLEEKYLLKLCTVDEIAKEANCGVANIRRLLKKYGIRRGHIIQKGKPAWNSGLTKETDKRIAKLADAKIGKNNPMFGKPAWNSGLTKETDDRLASISSSLEGRTFSDETRGKIGEQSNAWNGGLQYANGYGVLRLSVNGERLYLHRHVAQTILGRDLSINEEVHHIDRNKMNNEPINLIVLDGVAHNKLHRAIELGFVSREAQISWLADSNIPFEVLV
jgi:hypothetical protein